MVRYDESQKLRHPKIEYGILLQGWSLVVYDLVYVSNSLASSEQVTHGPTQTERLSMKYLGPSRQVIYFPNRDSNHPSRAELQSRFGISCGWAYDPSNEWHDPTMSLVRVSSPSRGSASDSITPPRMSRSLLNARAPVSSFQQKSDHGGSYRRERALMHNGNQCGCHTTAPTANGL